MAKSKIEWTEVTWNVITGCSKVSPGCKNCYAERQAERFWGERKFTDIICHEDRLKLPLHWKKPRTIFVNSMSDLFHEEVPFEFIKKVWDVMFDTSFEPNKHIYQILTKRPSRMLEFSEWMRSHFQRIDYDNVWLGVSVENQKTADERIPILLETPAAVKWISAEPLLENIDLRHYLIDETGGFPKEIKEHHNYLDWVVVGGESGPKKRPFSNDWARQIRDDCKKAGVPFFMKQVDKVQPIPEDLRIREYPGK